MLEEVDCDHVVTVDIFREQIAGFFSTRCCFDTLSYLPSAARYFFWRRASARRWWCRRTRETWSARWSWCRRSASCRTQP